jgi:hypothetical protein
MAVQLNVGVGGTMALAVALVPIAQSLFWAHAKTAVEKL